MGYRINLTGNKYGKLLVKSFHGNDKAGRSMWLCRCDCGSEKIVAGDNLCKGRTVKCGAHKRDPLKDLAGQRFGRLKVLRYSGRSKWVCLCDCGKEVVVWRGGLTQGTQKSCGCWKIEVATTHGKSHSREMQTYYSARYRCNNPKCDAYKDYGGRGIQFRFTSFEQFLEVLGPRPEGTTLDRINNDGHYEPGNVRWATAKQQRHNQRIKKIEEFKDVEIINEFLRRGLQNIQVLPL